MSPFVRKIFKISLWSLLCLFVSLLIAIGSIALYINSNKDVIKNVLMGELNKCLVAPISVQNVEFSVFRTFPFVSVEFQNVRANGSNPDDREILFSAQTISLHFNLISFLRGDFDIHEIEVDGGEFNIKRYKNLKNNYIIWRYNPGAKPISFHLKKIRSKNTVIRYRDLKNKLDLQFLCNNITAKGDLYNANQNFKLKGNYYLEKIASGDNVYMHNLAGKVNVDISHVVNKRVFFLNKGEILIDNLKFRTKGKIFYDPDIILNNNLELTLSGENLDLECILNYLPESVQKHLIDYTLKGRLAVVFNMKGNYKYNDYSISLKYNYKNGRAIHKASNIAVDDINASGSYTNGKFHALESSSFSCSSLSAKIGTGNIKGAVSISNFISPHICFNGEIQGNLYEISKFFGQSKDVNVKGDVRLSVEYENNFASFDIKQWTREEILKAKCNADMNLKKFYLEMPYSHPFSIYTDSARIVLSAQALYLQPCTIKLNEQTLYTNIRLENLLPYWLSKNEDLYVSADVSATSLNLEDWAYLLNSNSNSDADVKTKKETVSDTVSVWHKNLLDHLYLDFNLSAKTIIDKRGPFKDVKARINYSPSLIQIDDLSLQAYDGKLYGNILVGVNPTPNTSISLSMSGYLEKVKIDKTFKAFDNFGQKQLTDENIKGVLSMNFDLKLDWNNNYEVDPNSIVFSSDVNIKNGSLHNVEALKKLSKFTGESELELIRFSELDNYITISKSVITIPKMHVNSSLLSLDFSGKHDFNNIVNYNVDIELSDMLSRKRKKRAIEEELGLIVVGSEEKIRLPLIISGPLSNPNISYDFKTSRVHTKEKFKKEREIIKNLLHKEREYNQRNNSRDGNDISQKKQWQEQEKGKFLIETEDDTENASKYKSKKKDTIKKAPSPVKVEWEE